MHKAEAKRPQVASTSDNPGKRRVAIIGAGFAGLTLANYLSSKKQTYQLFESKGKPIPILGKFCLPNLRKVLQELNLQDTAALQWCKNNDNDMVPREELLNVLRDNVHIQSSCRISTVQRRASTTKDGKNCSWQEFFLHTDAGAIWGPFDVVVASSGLFVPKSISRHAMVIGDATRCNRWWDFGHQRRTRGGDLAMRDGLEFGKLLVRNDDPRYNHFPPPTLSPITAVQMLVLAATVLLGIIYQYSVNIF